MNAPRLLEQFMELWAGGLGGVAGGLAEGGLLGMLIGNKKARKKVGKPAGGAVGYGGAAALRALGCRARRHR